ncbi:uncharacterized protein [Ptychodera flava]
MPESGHRLRLRPWIIQQIDSGKYKGLDWIDESKTEFRVPWKHAAKNDYDQEEDSKIFRAWSLHTGKYKEGIDKVEPAVWKTRLRTALNKLPDVYEVRDKKIRSAEGIPFRVYKLLPQREHPWSRRDDEFDLPERRHASRKNSISGRKRRRFSFTSAERDNSQVAMETEKKKVKKENDFKRIHFKKREKFRSFNVGRSSPRISPPVSSSGDVEVKPPLASPESDAPSSDNTSPQTKVFPDKLQVSSNTNGFPDKLPVSSNTNGLLVTATLAANGLPVAMTVVPTSHTASSTNSVVSSEAPSKNISLPVQSTPTTSATSSSHSVNGHQLPVVSATKNGLNSNKTLCSVANSSKPCSNQQVNQPRNGHIPPQSLELTNFKPMNLTGISQNMIPSTTILPYLPIKSEPVSNTPAQAHPQYNMIPNRNGLIFSYPGMSHPALQPLHLPTAAPMLINGLHLNNLNTSSLTPLPPSVSVASPSSNPMVHAPLKDKPEKTSCMPKIESVVSLGMIAAKLLESQKMDPDGTIKMEEEEEAVIGDSKLQPIPLNYVMNSKADLASQKAGTPTDNLLVEINYKCTKALKYQVTNPNGCHISYINPMIKEEAIEIEYGPVDVEQINFPNFDEFCLSEKQTELTTTLLQHMEKGLLLKCKDGDVFLTRFGRTVVFWSTSQDESKDPEKTKRFEEIKIFDYQKFQSDVRNYFRGLAPCPEPPKIFLGIGQQWSSKYPLKNNLVSVIVTPLRAMEDYIALR